MLYASLKWLVKQTGKTLVFFIPLVTNFVGQVPSWTLHNHFFNSGRRAATCGTDYASDSNVSVNILLTHQFGWPTFLKRVTFQSVVSHNYWMSVRLFQETFHSCRCYFTIGKVIYYYLDYIHVTTSSEGKCPCKQRPSIILLLNSTLPLISGQWPYVNYSGIAPQSSQHLAIETRWVFKGNIYRFLHRHLD